MHILYLITKEVDDTQKFKYLFRIYGKNEEFITMQTLKEMLESFESERQLNNFKYLKKISEEQFLEYVQECPFSLEPLNKFRYVIFLNIGIKPKTPEEEKFAVLSLLNNELDLDQFLQDNLLEGKEFFLINKKFWNQWTQYVGINMEIGQSYRSDRPKGISNKDLLEGKSKICMKSILLYNQDYIVLPE